jgi:hypothetical protein
MRRIFDRVIQNSAYDLPEAASISLDLAILYSDIQVDGVLLGTGLH